MKAPALPSDEAERLADLRGYQVLDSEREAVFDRLTQLASTLFDVPIALISLVDEARQWFKSIQGLERTETPREISFCGHAILNDAPMVVPDAREDDRFADNPFVVQDPNVRFYAGAPLVSPRGHRLGTLCIIDRKARDLTPLQRQVLTDLAALVVDELELRLARREKERERHELRLLLTTFPVPVVVMGEGEVRFANKPAHTLLGYGDGELNGKSHLSLIHPDEQAASAGVAQSSLQPDAAPRMTRRRMLTRSGDTLTVDATVNRLSWGGRPAVVVAIRDVTEELRAQIYRDQLAGRITNQLTLMRAVFDVVPDGIVLFDPAFRCVYANNAFGEMVGMESDAIRGWTPERANQHLRTLIDVDDNQITPPTEQLRELSKTMATAHVFTLARPRPRVLRRTLHALQSPEVPYVSVWNDITHEVAQLARKEEEAFTDPLTSLLNRRAVEFKLSRAVTAEGLTSLVLFDIDHFKRINDTFGHPTGDEVLKRVARALASASRAGDAVGRWGGEEFIALLRTDLDGARRFAERARLAVAALNTPAGQVTISAGIAQKDKVTDLLGAADAKLYEAKHHGRNQVRG